jgi:protein TonB
MIVETTDPRCLDLPSPVPGRSDTFGYLSDDGGGDSVRPGGLLPLAMATALHGWLVVMLMTMGTGTGMPHGVMTVSLFPAGVMSGHADGSALPEGGAGREGGASAARDVFDVGQAMIPSTAPESSRTDDAGEDMPVAEEQASRSPVPSEPVADVEERPSVAGQAPAVEKKSVSSPEPVAVKVAAEFKKPASPPEPRSAKPPAVAKKSAAGSKPAGARPSSVASGADVPVSRSQADGADSEAAGARPGNGPLWGLAGVERGPVGIGGPGIGDGPVSAGFGSSDGPRFVRRVEPRYPEIARRRGREGRVLLRLVIGTGGELKDVEVVEGGGHGFEEAALAAVRASEYAPAVRGGRPVECAALLPIRFSLRGS